MQFFSIVKYSNERTVSVHKPHEVLKIFLSSWTLLVLCNTAFIFHLQKRILMCVLWLNSKTW